MRRVWTGSTAALTLAGVASFAVLAAQDAPQPYKLGTFQ